MVGEIVDRVGALPLLQYTLTELFEARVGRTITARRLPRRRRRVADPGPTGRLAARRARPGDGGDGPARVPPTGQRRRRQHGGRDATPGPGRRGGGAGPAGPGPASARHVRTAPPAELRSRPRHARADRGDLPRGAAHGVDHAADLDRRRPRRPAHAPPPRRRDERVDGRRLLTGLPPARWPARRHRRVGRDDDDRVATGRAPVPRRQPRRARRGAAGAAGGGATHDRGRAPGPATHPPARARRPW